MTETPLDRAHAAMTAAPEDDRARLAFYDRLAEAELVLLLSGEPEGDQVSPELFPVEDADYVVAFDTEERLAAFAGRIVPCATLSGRALAAMLAGQGLGLALNPDVAPSAILIPADAIGWLAATLGNAPTETEARPVEVGPPEGVPEALLSALDAKLPSAAGLARLAYLAGVTYEGGRRGHLLALVDVVPGSEDSLARAVGEALTFSGIDAGELDVAVFRASDPMAARLARVGLRIDLPEAEASAGPAAPGMDPNRPPRLK